MSHLATKEYSNVCNTATEVDNHCTLLNILVGSHRKVRNEGVGHEILNSDVLLLEALVEALAHVAIREDEVVCSFEHMTIRAYRLVDNLVVDGVAYSLHVDDILAVVGELNAAHAAVEILKVAIGDLVAAQLILDIYVVCHLHATHKVARETCIGLRNLDVELLLYALLDSPHSTSCSLAILNVSSVDARDGLRCYALDVYATIIFNRSHSDNHI